jgi:penicillin amidase
MSIRIERLALAILMAITIAAAPLVADALVTNRDDKGVWFITGSPDETVYDIFEAMGYAVATDRLWQLAKMKRLARGRLAEIFGPDYLDSDIYQRISGYSDDELQAGFDALSADARDMVSGYVAGINRRIAEVSTASDRLPYEFRALGILPEPWAAKDVLAGVAVLQRNFDPEAYDKTQSDNYHFALALSGAYPDDFPGMFQDLRWTNDPDAQTYFSSQSTAAAASRSNTAPSSTIESDSSSFSDIGLAFLSMYDRHKAIDEKLKKINASIKMGSYAWVVDGSKTASGAPLSTPAPRWAFPCRPSSTRGPSRRPTCNISGMNVAGIPGIIIGRTPHHAWSMQVGHAHTTDYYVEAPAVSLSTAWKPSKVTAARMMSACRSTAPSTVRWSTPCRSTRRPMGTEPIVAWKYAHWGYEFGSPWTPI